jgi:hypothetical protein
MSHPLEQQIAALRRKVRGLVWLHGLSLVVAVTLAAALLLGLVDYVSHFSLSLRRIFADPGIRIISSLALLGAIGWAVWRFLYRGVRAGFQDLDLALRVERRHPGLRDLLTSSVEFLQEAEEDPEAGSPELRRAVIAQTTALAENTNFSDVVNARPALLASGLAAAIALLAATAIALDPAAARIVAARLANPWSGPQWPQETHLAFQPEVTRAAAGRPLDLVVVDAHGAALPKSVTLYVRYDGSPEEQALAMRPADDSMVFRFTAVSRPFTYWAEGGDDVTMRRQPLRLEVIEPPVADSLDVQLIPPAYTNWPPAKSEKNIRALHGTRVVFRGSSSKPLVSATLCVGAADKPEVQVPARVSDDGYGFEIDPAQGQVFEVTRSGQYWFRLEDTEGIVGDDAAYELRGVPDGPPSVVVESPAQDAEFTANAVVSLVVIAKDDLALQDLSLKFARSDHSEQSETVVPLHTGPGRPAVQLDGLASSRLGESRTVTHRWSLKELKLAPGTQVTFYAAASDYKPQVGQSLGRRLRIISPEQLLDRISEQQRLILGKLAEVLQQERAARGQLSGVQIQWKEVGRLDKPDLDRLEGTRLLQDRLNDALTNDTAGVTALISRLLASLRDNQVDSPDIQRRMQGLLDEIDGLKQGPLPGIIKGLRDAATAAQSKLDTPQGASPEKDVQKKLQQLVGENLTGAGRQQDEVISALERILGQMTEWDHYHRFQRDIAALRRENDDIAAETAKVGQETLTKDAKDLTPQQQANLKKLAKRQQDAARDLDAILQRMERMKGQLQDENPLAAGVLDDALHQARSQGISGQMRQAAGNVERNQVGQAAERQKSASDALQEMQNILANRKAENLSRLVKQLKEAEAQLQDLLNRQKGLHKKIEAAAANPNEAERRRELKRLTEEQRRLQEETDRFARKLRRLQAEQAAAAASSAAGQMGKAGGASQQGESGAAEKSSQQALEDLQDAQQQLADARRQAELDLAMEQLAKIEDALTGLKNRQQTVVADTQRLEKVRADQGQLSRGQKESVRTLSRQEAQLLQETTELAKKLEPAAVFNAALKGAAGELQLAADLLAQYETGAATQRAEANALRRFEQLLLALKPEPAGDKKKDSNSGSGGSGNKQPPMPVDGIPSLAQLKMLKLMQDEINQRTKELNARLGVKKPGELTETDRREHANISQQQGEIARLTLNLSKPTEPDPEMAPDALPDFSLDEGAEKKDNPPEREPGKVKVRSKDSGKTDAEKKFAPKKSAPKRSAPLSGTKEVLP